MPSAYGTLFDLTRKQLTLTSQMYELASVPSISRLLIPNNYRGIPSPAPCRPSSYSFNTHSQSSSSAHRSECLWGTRNRILESHPRSLLIGQLMIERMHLDQLGNYPDLILYLHNSSRTAPSLRTRNEIFFLLHFQLQPCPSVSICTKE